MAFERLINNLRERKRRLIDNRPIRVMKIAFDMWALTKLRIQTEGKDFNEQPFAPYTEAYKKERGAAGYQTGFVDFTRTGRFMANSQPRILSSDTFSTTVIIEGSEQRSKDIARGAEKKRGNIYTPSKAEIEFGRQANQQRVFEDLFG